MRTTAAALAVKRNITSKVSAIIKPMRGLGTSCGCLCASRISQYRGSEHCRRRRWTRSILSWLEVITSTDTGEHGGNTNYKKRRSHNTTEPINDSTGSQQERRFSLAAKHTCGEFSS